MSNSSASTLASKVVLKRKKSTLCEIKITILGDRNVGKSAIVVRFITRRYIIEYEHGIDNKHKHEVMIDNEPVIFDINDSSSHNTLSINNFDISSHSVDLLLLVYSITDRQSFNYVKNFLKHIAQLKANGTQVPMIAVCGNKCDLIHLRQVSHEESELLHNEFSGELITLNYGEISAADQQVNQLFADLYRWVKKTKIVPKSLTPSSLLDKMVIGIKGSASNGSTVEEN